MRLFQGPSSRSFRPSREWYPLSATSSAGASGVGAAWTAARLVAAASSIPDRAAVSPWSALTGVGKGHWLGLAMDGEPEAGRGLGPRFGREPEATPEPAAREQVAQPLQAEPEGADPSRTGRGRRSQPARRAAGPVRLLRPPAVRGRPQGGDRQ